MKLFWWLEGDSKLFDEFFWKRECWVVFLVWGFKEDVNPDVTAPRGVEEALNYWLLIFKCLNEPEIFTCAVYFIGILLI